MIIDHDHIFMIFFIIAYAIVKTPAQIIHKYYHGGNVIQKKENKRNL
jgi:hypothetical protein